MWLFYIIITLVSLVQSNSEENIYSKKLNLYQQPPSGHFNGPRGSVVKRNLNIRNLWYRKRYNIQDDDQYSRQQKVINNKPLVDTSEFSNINHKTESQFIPITQQPKAIKDSETKYREYFNSENHKKHNGQDLNEVEPEFSIYDSPHRITSYDPPPSGHFPEFLKRNQNKERHNQKSNSEYSTHIKEKEHQLSSSSITSPESHQFGSARNKIVSKTSNLQHLNNHHIQKNPVKYDDSEPSSYLPQPSEPFSDLNVASAAGNEQIYKSGISNFEPSTKIASNLHQTITHIHKHVYVHIVPPTYAAPSQHHPRKSVLFLVNKHQENVHPVHAVLPEVYFV